MKILKNIYKYMPVALIIYLSLGVILGAFTKLLGIIAFTTRLFFVFFFTSFLIMPFIASIVEENKNKRITSFLFGIVAFSIFVIGFKAPQTLIIQFYYETKNHITLENLDANDISFIATDRITIAEPETIAQITNALNNSTWYAPNHERRGKEVPMVIVFKSGEKLHCHISRFYGEDSVDLLFIRPHETGYWADGNAYVPNLTSILEKAGYILPVDY